MSEFRAMKRRQRPESHLAAACFLVVLINLGFYFLAGDEPNMFGAVLIVLISPIANLLMCIVGLVTLAGWGTDQSSRLWRFEPLIFIVVCVASAIGLFAATRLRYNHIGG